MAELLEPKLDLCQQEARHHFFTELYYRVFPAVAKYVHTRKGTLEDAQDIFHDALILLYEKKIAGGEYNSDDAYLMGIVKHLWIKKSGDAKDLSLEESDALLTIPDDIQVGVNEQSVLLMLKSAGKRCLDLLQEFYYHNQSLEMIKTTFGFGSIRSATVQKFKCLEKIRDVVKTKSKMYEDFLE